MKRILFITAHRLGDAVIAMGALAGMMERHPQARFTIACGPAVQDLFRYMPRCERIIVVEKKPHNRHWLALWWQVVRHRWEVVVDLRSSPLAYGVWSRSRHVVRGGRRTGLKLEQQTRALGFRQPFRPHVWLGPEEQDMAARLLPGDIRWLALAPTAGTETKLWPASSFAALADRLGAEGMRPVLFYGPGEREARLAAPARAAMPEALDLGGRYSLAQVAALLARCCLFVGSDSGLMHLSAALDVPTLGLFGPSRAAEYAPSGRWTAVVEAPGPPGAGNMEGLKAEDVCQAALSLYEWSGEG
ncbi:MAG: glycosyltransferase family 9 protein [Bombella apis]|uniref:glycosyltransferase family 9 protein n=1 Tax=Bombella apis TaxID=1785988 RepID=UPI0023F56258|nr:glycosyltransferase family 9 protein [Bombella apis]MCT6819011.1 glycosyltransferase family 9 protein [Bombella apis]